jgi:hypothetical protein
MTSLQPILVPLSLLLWIAFSWWCFRRFPPATAAMTALVSGWLFLPLFPIQSVRIPYFETKPLLVPGFVIIISYLRDRPTWQRLRRSWADLPMMVLILSPTVTSILNGLGLKDGLQSAWQQLLFAGCAWLLGRLYFGSFNRLKQAALVVFLGALVYVPFCLWEIRMSPQLHSTFYGTPPDLDFNQTIRFGGYRPVVFMRHGLMTAMWMTCGSLVGFWMWRSRAVEKVGNLRMGWLTLAVIGTTILCKSLGALVLLAGALVVVFSPRWLRATLLLLLLLLPPVYQSSRMLGWRGELVSDWAEKLGDADRRASVLFRTMNEEGLVRHALERPWFGWGRFGRNLTYDEWGNPTVTDSAWIIVLGIDGLVNLAAYDLLVILPFLLFWLRVPLRFWDRAAVAPAASMALFILLYGIDNLFNALPNPAYMAMAGGLTSLALARAPEPRRAKAPRRQRALAAGVASAA